MEKKPLSKKDILMYVLIALFILANIFLAYTNFSNFFTKEKLKVYCIDGEKLTEELNLISGMRCNILRFEFDGVEKSFYEKLINNTHGEQMVCRTFLNDNECNYYDFYYFGKRYVNDSNFAGNVYEMSGIKYEYGNYSLFKYFFKDSKEVSYEEGYKQIK